MKFAHEISGNGSVLFVCAGVDCMNLDYISKTRVAFHVQCSDFCLQWAVITQTMSKSNCKYQLVA